MVWGVKEPRPGPPLDSLRSRLRYAWDRIRPAASWWRLGIAPRLFLTLVAVIALAVLANQLAGGKLSVLQVTEVWRERPVARTAPAPVPADPFRSATAGKGSAGMGAATGPTGVAADGVPPAGVPSTGAVPSAIQVPFPSTDALLRALDRVGSAVDASADTDAAEIDKRYQKASEELSRIAGEFSAAAGKAGESPPARFMPAVRSYSQHGGELIKLAAARRAAMADYSAHFEQLNGRVKKSLDHAWNIFGRVVARQSLVKLTSDLDELRRRYGEISATDTVDSSTFDALGSSEATLAQTLTQDRGGLTRSDGNDWYTRSQVDLLAMSAARKALMQIDRRRRNGARRFGEDLATLSQILGELGKTETYEAHAAVGQTPALAGNLSGGVDSPLDTNRWARSGPPRLAAPELGTVALLEPIAAALGPSNSAHRGPYSENPATAPAGRQADSAWEASKPSTATSVGVVSRRSGDIETVKVQRTDSATVLETPDDGRRVLMFWVGGAVVVIVACMSVFTALGILRPVRRLLSATSRIANGEAGVTVPRGGLRELDTLAAAFNDMAVQLAAAQESARHQSELLEAKVAERTAQLQEMAQLDPLTRLANRRHFFTLLNAAIETASRENRLVGVFFVDVDNFKHVNDGLGHEYGDALLQMVAQRLSDSTHSFGFAARLGGDEFTVVYESASTLEDIRIAGLQLVKAFEEPLPLEGRELVLSVSAGASVYPEHARDAEGLLRGADAALYQAKALGRGQLALFTPALLENTTARFAIEQGLRRAIERNEFHLVFQPEINLHTGETELVEALLRWRLPDGSYASPGEFLGVAEASGLIFQINDWVLRQALETLAQWRSGPWPTARVAINVSSRQLFDHSFVDRVQSLLASHELPPSCLEIELTEHVLQTGSATIAALRELHNQGIAIALDDFGAGFSSLASLEQLPLTRIKLDRSLIAAVDTSARSAAIARAIIHLCQDLGLSITAEGIERLQQLAPLVGHAGLYVQGFLFASPQSSEDVLRAMQTLPTLARALVGSCVARLPEAALAQTLPVVVAAAADQ